VSTERDDDTELPYASAQKPIPFYDYLKPGPAYIAPASGFFLSNASHHAGLSDFLPSRLAADRLIKQYFSAVHPIAKLVHRPSFEREYESFWEVVSMGMEPPGSAQAIVFAAMFSGVVSMDESAVLRDFGVSKASLIENFQLGTETALGRANFLRTTKVETLQGFVMYMVSLLSVIEMAQKLLILFYRFLCAVKKSPVLIPSWLALPFGWQSAWVCTAMEKLMD
jgi:hypothetical protein